jgi:23S rRNA pseudouridine2457 synthase
MRYFLVDKPFGMLSQFTREHPDHRVLGELHPFPKEVYPVGRLDRDSEGLLILTDDGRLNQALLHPRFGHPRTYWVQVEGIPDAATRRRLAAGPTIRVKKQDHRCHPLTVLPIEVNLPDRDPPVRARKTVPDSWLALTLTEGKNRQVRRMCAAVGHPVLRLIRHAIGEVSRADLGGQAVRKVDGDWLLARLRLNL